MYTVSIANKHRHFQWDKTHGEEENTCSNHLCRLHEFINLKYFVILRESFLLSWVDFSNSQT